MRSSSVRFVAAALGVVLAVSACSSSGGAATPRRSASRSTQAGAAGTTTYGTALPAGLAGVGQLPRPASAWPAANFDARHSSATTATGPQTAAVRWKHVIGGNATPGPVLAADGSVLAATSSGTLFDLDARTGDELWHYSGGSAYGAGDLSTSPAVLPGGTILWPGPEDTLFALSPAGKLLWSQKLGGLPLSPAVAGAHRVYVSDLAGHLSAFEITATSHRLVWTLDTHGTDYASATVGPDGTIYTVGGRGGTDLYAVRDLGSRAGVRWIHHATRMLEVSNGISPDGTLVLGTNTGSEFGITSGGTIAWTVPIGDFTYSSSVVRPDGTGYFGDNAGRLWIVAAGSGRVTGPIVPLGAGKERIWSSPVVDAKGDVYWATTEGNVYGYTAGERSLFRLALGSGVNSYPALGADGTLYVSTTGGAVVAIGG